MNITTALKNQLTALSSDQRTRLVAIAHRHVEACRRQEVAVDAPARVLQEALDLMALEDKSGKQEIEDWTREAIGLGLQRQQYEQYTAPIKDAKE